MSQPIRPPTAGLTPEAAEHLIQSGHVVTDSDTDTSEFEEDISSPFMSMSEAFVRPEMSDGSVVDAEIVDDGTGLADDPVPSFAKARRARPKSDAPKTPREAKTGPPSLDEWTGFFSRVVLRVATEYYISFAFRGIDEDILTEREVERLAMTDDERQLIAVPFAEISNKSKFMRKHGRMIVASGDAFNAMVVFGMWMSRVNRIAAKYRPKQPKAQVRINGNGSSGPGTPEANGAEGTGGGYVPPGFRVFPGSG